MRRSAITYVVVPVLLLLTLTACGGGGSSTSSSTTVSSITVNPLTISVNKGDVQQLAATALGSGGNQVAADFTYTSSNPDLVSISTGGLLCGGKWDNLTTPIVCTPTTLPAGTADVTVQTGSVTFTMKAYVHDKVDVVEVNDVPACVSMGETTQLAAAAFSTNPAVCGGASRCQLPPATIGPFLWVPTATSVVKIDNTYAANGLATAGVPGLTSFYASNANNHSITKSFTTCPVTSITLTVKDSTADPFTYAKAETKSLVAVVKDSAGKTLDGTKLDANNVAINVPPILWVNSQPFTSSVIIGSGVATNTATATASNPGPGLLMATCPPPNCNLNLPPAYSNPILATVSGTANATIYAASTTSLSLIPIDSATNTAGTAITLPFLPNSMMVNSLGTKLLLGADSGGFMLVDTTTGTVTTGPLFGKVIGFAADGVHGLVFDPSRNFVFAVNVSNGSPDFAIQVTGTATSADTTPDGDIYFAAVGNALYSFDQNQGQRKITLPGIANEITVLASGPAVYTPIKSGNIQARATCQPATVVDSQTAAAPTNIKTLPNGNGAVAVDSPNLIVLHSATVSGDCPITLTESRTAVDLQGGAFKPNQLLITPDSNIAFVTNDTGKLLSYNISTATVNPITLAAGATASFTMGATLDSKFVYVGASDGTVHKIDTSTMTDTQQIAVGLKKADATAAIPDLVAVRAKP